MESGAKRDHWTEVDQNHNKRRHWQELNTVKVIDMDDKSPPPPYPGTPYAQQQYTSPQQQHAEPGYPQHQFVKVSPAGYPPGAAGYPPGAAGYSPGAAGYPPGVAGYPAAPVGQVMYHVPPSVPCGLTNRPEDCLFFNIFTCLCCCWPVSIFAIWKSMESRKAADRGDREAATRNAAVAKQLGIGSFVIGLLLQIGLWVYVSTTLSKAQNGTDVENAATTTRFPFDNYL